MGHEFSSTQFNLPAELAGHVKRAAKKIPDWALAEDGREKEPHVTVKYGIHGDDPAPVRNAVRGHAPFKIKLGKTSVFLDSGSGDVVKAEVHSPALHGLNRRISGSVKHTDTHPGYKPHVTVAYVKAGLGKKFAGDASLEGKEAMVDHFHFSDRNGKKTRIGLREAPTGKRYGR